MEPQHPGSPGKPLGGKNTPVGGVRPLPPPKLPDWTGQKKPGLPAASGPRSPVPGAPAAGPKSPVPGAPKKAPASGTRPAVKPAPPGSTKKRPATSGTPKPVPPEVAAKSMSARVGHYVKIQKIGSGSMGDVFKSWDLREGRWVALKILRSNDMVQLARFIREAQLASQLNHAHITPIYDAGKDNEKHLWYIAMKYIVGHTLRSFPRASRRIVAQVMADAARALAYAHEKGIVHRDIKPENFMVTSTPKPGVPKSKSIEAFDHHLYVMDFGIARPSDANTQLTMPGTVMGSPAFMSPEQASGRPVDFRADVYSLGATLYDRLVGEPPFSGNNIFDVLRRVQEESPLPPHIVDPTVPVALSQITMKCLEKDVAKRFQTAGDLADALEAWATEPVEAAPAASVKKGCGSAAAVLLAAATGAAVLLAV